MKLLRRRFLHLPLGTTAFALGARFEAEAAQRQAVFSGCYRGAANLSGSTSEAVAVDGGHLAI